MKVVYSEWATPIVKANHQMQLYGNFKATLSPVLDIFTKTRRFICNVSRG